MDYKERLKNLKEDYRDKIADETIKMFYQGFEIDAVKSRIKGKYPEFSVADINDIVDKTFKNMSKKESYKEKLTLDDVALKKFGKRYNQLTSDEKKECNYIYSEWSDDDYDEGYKKKESYKKRLRSLKEGYGDDIKIVSYKNYDIELVYHNRGVDAFIRPKGNKLKSFDDTSGKDEKTALQNAKAMIDTGRIEESYKEKLQRLKEQTSISDGLYIVSNTFELTPGGGWGIRFYKGDLIKYNNKRLYKYFKQRDEWRNIRPPISGTYEFNPLVYGGEDMGKQFANNCRKVSQDEVNKLISKMESFKEFNKFDDVRIKSKNLSGMIYEISGNDVVVKTIKGLVKTTKDDLELHNKEESYKESSEENIIGYIHDCLLNNPSAGVNEIKNKIKTKYGMDIDMNTISKEINKFNSRESFREKLNKLKETMNGDKYIQLTGPFNLPKINNMVSQLCNDYGLVFAADGRIFYDDRNSLLKREINAFLAELKNIGLSYRLSEKMIKEKLNCLKI